MRSWLVIPAMGAASGAAAVALGVAPATVVPIALAGAAITAAVRALIGDSAASLAGAVIAPLLLLAALFDPGLAHGELARASIAIAAAAWTVLELARPTTSPLVAVLPAVVAAVLDPSFVALVAIAGARLITAPWERPRWAIAVPIVGGLAILLAVIAGVAHGGALGTLGDRWTGSHAHGIGFAILIARAGEVLGPVLAVAALGGLAVLVRARHAEVAIAACAVGSVLVDLRAGGVGPSLVAIAALSAGLAVGKLAGQIRLAAGQAVAGALAGALLIVPPAWIAIERGPRVAIDHASR